jgi:hypothetical protein
MSLALRCGMTLLRIALALALFGAPLVARADEPQLVPAPESDFPPTHALPPVPDPPPAPSRDSRLQPTDGARPDPETTRALLAVGAIFSTLALAGAIMSIHYVTSNDFCGVCDAVGALGYGVSALALSQIGIALLVAGGVRLHQATRRAPLVSVLPTVSTHGGGVGLGLSF